MERLHIQPPVVSYCLTCDAEGPGHMEPLRPRQPHLKYSHTAIQSLTITKTGHCLLLVHSLSLNRAREKKSY